MLARVCSTADLSDIATNRLNGSPARPFQQLVAQSDRRVTFVKAGCGSGKTVAAYLWAAQRAAGRKIFLCYPTTGTATEGFRDYVIPSELAPDAQLLHSRSELDIEALQQTGDEDLLESVHRINSLRTWDTPLTVCTADTVLGIMQNHRRGLYALPSLVLGGFVFDEIHQYDDRLFSSLLHFLEPLRRPGAADDSVPAGNSAGRPADITGDDFAVIAGPNDLERIPRYCINTVSNQALWDTITATLSAGQKSCGWLTRSIAPMALPRMP